MSLWILLPALAAGAWLVWGTWQASMQVSCLRYAALTLSDGWARFGEQNLEHWRWHVTNRGEGEGEIPDDVWDWKEEWRSTLNQVDEHLWAVELEPLNPRDLDWIIRLTPPGFLARGPKRVNTYGAVRARPTRP